MFLDSGKCFGFREVFLDSGKCFGFWEVFLDSETCFGFWDVFCPYEPPYKFILFSFCRAQLSVNSALNILMYNSI